MSYSGSGLRPCRINRWRRPTAGLPSSGCLRPFISFVSSASFHFVHPDSFPFLPIEVVKFFEKAASHSESMLTPNVLLQRARGGIGEIFVIEKDGVIVGAVYLIIQDTDMGRILNIPLLGGKHMKHWASDLRAYVRQIMMQHRVERLVVISCRPWWKFFPELKEDSVIYTARILH